MRAEIKFIYQIKIGDGKINLGICLKSCTENISRFACEIKYFRNAGKDINL